MSNLMPTRNVICFSYHANQGVEDQCLQSASSVNTKTRSIGKDLSISHESAKRLDNQKWEILKKNFSLKKAICGITILSAISFFAISYFRNINDPYDRWLKEIFGHPQDCIDPPKYIFLIVQSLGLK